MRGHIRKRGKTWSIVLDVGTDERGRRRQQWHSGYRTKNEAEDALTMLLGQLQTGTYVAPTRRTVSEFLTEEWLPAIRHTVRPLTFESYERACRNHLVPQLGDVPLQRLTAAQVNAVYAMLLGRLAPGTVRQVHAVLHRALEAAVRWGYVVRNVADAADPPTPTRKREIRTWTAGELAGLLAAAEGHQASDAFSRLVKRSGVPRIGGIHALRHGWATLALQAGVHPKVVAERLGHASVRITLDTYSHVTAGMQEDAAATVARLVGLD